MALRRRYPDASCASTTHVHVLGDPTSVAKFVHGRSVGTAAQRGSLTFSPQDEPSEWVLGGVCEIMHVYIAPSLIQRTSSSPTEATLAKIAIITSVRFKSE
jgi:hypothetical protein